MRYILPIIPLVFGLCALVGWGYDIRALERIGTASIPINPITALCFIVLSLELLFIHFKAQNSGFTLVRQIAILAVMVCSCIKLSDLLLHTSFEIDSSIFTSKLNAELPKPNRMAPNTAFNLLLLSLALQLFYFRFKYSIVISQILALATTFIAMLAIIGYMFNIHSFYGLGIFNPMSRNSAISFNLLAISTLLAGSHKGFMRIIVSKGPAGRMASFLLPSSVLVPLGVGWLRLVGQRQNFYDSESGIALSITLNIVMMVTLTFITGRLLYITDIKRRKLEARLHAMASHDSLTGLVNRRQFLTNLTRRTNLLKREPTRQFALFYLDIDGLKQVNDQLGHETGDQLLIQVANILRRSTRISDTVARLGGDEFTILFEEIKNPDDINVLADRILNAMPRSWSRNNINVSIGISIGVTVAAIGDITPKEILHCADSALNRAKTEGKNCYRLVA